MEILATAYRILDVIAQPVAIAGQEVTHTASIGNRHGRTGRTE